jgi:hypothetical protein
MNPYVTGALQINRQRLQPNVIRLDWSGRSDARRPGELLQPYLATVLDEARESRCSVEMHFETLDFFNSSTVSVLVQFLQVARVHRIPLRYSYREEVRWQKLCFEALRVFEVLDDLVRVVPVDRAPVAR